MHAETRRFEIATNCETGRLYVARLDANRRNLRSNSRHSKCMVVGGGVCSRERACLRPRIPCQQGKYRDPGQFGAISAPPSPAYDQFAFKGLAPSLFVSACKETGNFGVGIREPAAQQQWDVRPSGPRDRPCTCCPASEVVSPLRRSPAATTKVIQSPLTHSGNRTAAAVTRDPWPGQDAPTTVPRHLPGFARPLKDT